MKREVKENVIPKTKFPLSLNGTQWPPRKAAEEELPGPCPFRGKFTKTSWLGMNEITLKNGQNLEVPWPRCLFMAKVGKWGK